VDEDLVWSTAYLKMKHFHLSEMTAMSCRLNTAERRAVRAQTVHSLSRNTAIGEDRTADAFKHLRLIRTIQSRDTKDTATAETCCL